MKIVVFKSSRLIRQRYRFSLVASNGEIVATSESYTRRIDAIDIANRIAAAEITVYDETSLA